MDAGQYGTHRDERRGRAVRAQRRACDDSGDAPIRCRLDRATHRRNRPRAWRRGDGAVMIVTSPSTVTSCDAEVEAFRIDTCGSNVSATSLRASVATAADSRTAKRLAHAS